MKTGLSMLFAGLAYILLNDILLYLGIKRHLRRKLYRCLYWAHSLLFIVGLILYHSLIPRLHGPELYFWVSESISVFLLFYAPKSVYLVFLGVSCLFKWAKCLPVARLVKGAGVVVSLLLFGLSFYGITWGRSAYKVERVDVRIAGLTDNFSGFRVVQLSDMHLGSCSPNFRGIPKLVEKVNSLKPDLIVFTGDMVNNFASEITPWIDVLRQLRAPYGKYAVTGNHDYGHYVRWDTPEAREENMRQFYRNMEAAGFTMLDNASAPLVIGQDTVFLCGVENWGLPPFPQYGKLQDALRGTEGHTVILLSHDPSHWRQEVVRHPVALTLSGHTHAMQVGFRIGGFRWSPSKYMYPEYNGLYSQDDCQLYVSRGAGFIGLAGRVGQRPEITLLELNR